MRIGFLHSPAEEVSESSSWTPRALRAVASQLTSKRIPFVTQLFKAALEKTQRQTLLTREDLLQIAKESSLNLKKFEEALNKDLELDALTAQRSFCQRVLEVPLGTSAVITNGRLVSLDESFIASDFVFLATFELQNRAEKVKEFLDSVSFDSVPAEDQTRYS